MEKIRINKEIIIAMMQLSVGTSAKENIDFLKKSYKLIFIGDDNKAVITEDELINLVHEEFDDGLSDLYEDMLHDDGGNVHSCGGIYLTDGMFLFPDGSIREED